jgi:hypothetical protein
MSKSQVTIDEVFEFCEWLLGNVRSRGRMEPSISSRDQQLLFPAGMTYDMKTGYGTTTTCMSFNRVREDSKGKNSLVAVLGMRWNNFVPWLHEMDALRRSHFFPAL